MDKDKALQELVMELAGLVVNTLKSDIQYMAIQGLDQKYKADRYNKAKQRLEKIENLMKEIGGA